MLWRKCRQTSLLQKAAAMVLQSSKVDATVTELCMASWPSAPPARLVSVLRIPVSGSMKSGQHIARSRWEHSP